MAQTATRAQDNLKISPKLLFYINFLTGHGTLRLGVAWRLCLTKRLGRAHKTKAGAVRSQGGDAVNQQKVERVIAFLHLDLVLGIVAALVLAWTPWGRDFPKLDSSEL